jgi:hypothetical protein
MGAKLVQDDERPVNGSGRAILSVFRASDARANRPQQERRQMRVIGSRLRFRLAGGAARLIARLRRAAWRRAFLCAALMALTTCAARLAFALWFAAATA